MKSTPIILLFAIICAQHCFGQVTSQEALDKGLQLGKTGYYKEAVGFYNRSLELDPTNYLALFNMAIAKKTMGDINGSLKDYTACIQLNAQNFEAYSNRASIYQELGDSLNALRDLNKAVELGPNNSVCWNNRGYFKLEKKQFATAIKDLEKAIELDPQYIQPRINKMECIFNLYGAEKALEESKKLIDLFPTHASVYLNTADLCIRVKDYSSAMLLYDKAIQMDKNDCDAFIARAKFKDDYGYDDEGSIADCNKAIALNPKKAEAYYCRARPKYDMKDYVAVADDCSKAIELDSNYYAALEMRGDAYDYLGKTELALLDYNKAIKLKPMQRDAYYQKTVLLANKNRLPEIVEMLDEYLKLNPDDIELQSQNIQCKLRIKKFKEAIVDLEKIIKKDPEDGTAYYCLAQAKDSLKDFKGSCNDLELALKHGEQLAYDAIKKSCPEKQKSKTYMYYDFNKTGIETELNGEFAEAITYYDKAIAVDPSIFTAYYNRGKAKRKLRKYDEAIKDYLEATKREPKFADAFISAGVAAYYLEDTALSIKYYKMGIGADSTNATSYYNVAIIYMERQEFTKAQPYLEKAVFYKKNYSNAYTVLGECHEMQHHDELACFYYKAGEYYGDMSAISKRIWSCRKR